MGQSLQTLDEAKSPIASGQKLPFASTGPNPIVAFEVYEPDHDGTLEMPKFAAFWQAKPHVDDHGIQCFLGADGALYYNVATVAFQAMGSPASYPDRLTLDSLTAHVKALTDQQVQAFKWLEQHHVVLTNGAPLWYYRFPLNYNNIVITSAWPSAFSQAAIMHAYLVAWRITGEPAWLTRAVQAAYAFEVPVEEGGLTAFAAPGLPFYEEVPLAHGYSPHILNGHLYSTSVLLRLAQEAQNERVRALAMQGIATAKAFLPLYDQGYWTRYDLPPRLIDLPLHISDTNRDVPSRVRKFVLQAPNGEKQLLDFMGSGNVPTFGPNKAYGDWGTETDGQGHMITGQAFIGMALPRAMIRDYRYFPGDILEIEFTGDPAYPPQASILGFRDGMKEYFLLPRLGMRSVGAVHTVVYWLDIRDLQWSYLQRYYVDWHARLVEDLWRQTGDPVFRVISVRWANYLSAYDSDIQAVQQQPTQALPVRHRAYTDTVNPTLDAALVEALDGLRWEQITPQAVALALLRYVYFRLEPGESQAQHAWDILEQGKGLSWHYAVVCEALAQRAGLRARRWHLAHVPDLGEHDLCEVEINGHWNVLDPRYGIFFSDNNPDTVRPLSFAELLQHQGVNVIYWEPEEKDKRLRGQAPPPVQQALPELFRHPATVPRSYHALIMLATAKAHVDGEQGKGWRDRSFAIQLEKAAGGSLGSASWTCTDGRWYGLAGLERRDGQTVAMYKPHTTTVRTVLRRYHLQGLVPGTIYRFEAGFCHIAQALSTVGADMKGLSTADMIAFSDDAKDVFTYAPRPLVVYFQAKNPLHEVELYVEDEQGYVHINYVEVSPTAFSALPQVRSTGARIVDQTAYYAGFGPDNALDGIPDNNYVAAQENTLPNTFTFALHSAVVPVALDLRWNSAQDYGKAFKLIGIAPGREQTLVDIQNNQLVATSENHFLIHTQEVFQQFRFELHAAMAQRRLLLLDLRLYGAVPAAVLQPIQDQFASGLQVDLAAAPAQFIPVKDRAGHEVLFTTLGAPVSVVRVGAHYLVANYAQIYLFDTQAHEIRQMEAVLQTPDAIPAPAVQGQRWLPTGLAYDASANLLYVANYQANNILYFAVDVEHNRLLLRGSIASPHTVSPENIALTSDARWLVSANYDGNSITAFHQEDDGEWRAVWVVHTQLGHGVAIAGDKVYATSLGSRQLLEIGLYDGTVRRSTGSLGWNPRTPEFLWPTAVAALDAGRLAIADAHTGRITILRTDTLEVETWFGANGPGWRFLNMPYAVVNDAGSMLILSTFQMRLMVIDSTTLQVTQNIVFGPPRWQSALTNPHFVAFGAHSVDDWNGYVHVQGPQITLGGVPGLLSYRHVYTVMPKTVPVVTVGEGVFNPADDFYFVQASFPQPQSTILTSPQCGGGVIYTNIGEMTYGTPLCASGMIPLDTWEINNQLFSPFGQVNTVQISATNRANIKRLESMRHADGMLSREAIFRTLASDCYTWLTFNARFTASFVSEPGKQFLEAYKLWETEATGAQTVKDAASTYFVQVSALDTVSMTEFVLVHMLTHIPASLIRSRMPTP